MNEFMPRGYEAVSKTVLAHCLVKVIRNYLSDVTITLEPLCVTAENNAGYVYGLNDRVLYVASPGYSVSQSLH